MFEALLGKWCDRHSQRYKSLACPRCFAERVLRESVRDVAPTRRVYVDREADDWRGDICRPAIS